MMCPETSLLVHVVVTWDCDSVTGDDRVQHFRKYMLMSKSLVGTTTHN